MDEYWNDAYNIRSTTRQRMTRATCTRVLERVVHEYFDNLLSATTVNRLLVLKLPVDE